MKEKISDLNKKIDSLINERRRTSTAIIEEIINYIKSENNGWISVKDFKPLEDKDVLCYRGYQIGGMKDVYRYKGNDVWEDTYGYWQTTEDEGISHWMELPPDPYEEV